MVAWKEQVKYRGLSEQPNDIRAVKKSCNMKLIIGITWINVNQNNTTAFERSVINYLGLEPVLQGPNLTLIFYSGSQHLVSCSVLMVNL